MVVFAATTSPAQGIEGIDNGPVSSALWYDCLVVVVV
jgi:hypothetical protein